jgi:multidrug transporter EmrE-like cation transporter
MPDRALGLVFVLLMLLVSFAFQLQAKQLANELAAVLGRWDGGLDQAVRLLMSEAPLWRGISVLLLAGLTFGLWLLALARLELSFALIFAATGLAFSTIGSGLMLGETLTMGRVLGIAVVTAGVLITVLS